VEPDSEIRDASQEESESADMQILESAFDSSYSPLGNLARLACVGCVFFFVARVGHAVFPRLSSRSLIYLGFVLVAVLSAFADWANVFHSVPELGFSRQSAVWRVLAESLGFTICVSLFFSGLGPPMSFGGIAFVFVILALLCGVYDAIKRRAAEPPLSMNLK
jgi:hypothetical protein